MENLRTKLPSYQSKIPLQQGLETTYKWLAENYARARL